MTMKKLKLNKERIAKLSNEESANIQGGGTDNSTNRTFTCCWCTSETSPNDTCATNQCSTEEPNTAPLCPVSWTCPPKLDAGF